MFGWLHGTLWDSLFKARCAKESEITKLHSELAESKRNYESLKAEIEQQYTKDTMVIDRSDNGHFVSMQYRSKQGKNTVSIVDHVLHSYPGGSSWEDKVIKEFSESQYLSIRDFLVKNFPGESIDNAPGNVRVKNRAFSDDYTDYYALTQDVGELAKGTVFYYDPEDSVRGSIAEGCLKLAWSSKGNCQCGLCGDTVVFHANFRNNPLFTRVTKEGQ